MKRHILSKSFFSLVAVLLMLAASHAAHAQAITAYIDETQSGSTAYLKAGLSCDYGTTTVYFYSGTTANAVDNFIGYATFTGGGSGFEAGYATLSWTPPTAGSYYFSATLSNGSGAMSEGCRATGDVWTTNPAIGPYTL